MAGLYVHIPFCKKRCLYCDFFSTTLLARRDEYVQALLKEIAQRKNEAGPIRTIYLGGGTPSTLETAHIVQILEAIGTQDAQEITMELNPGDADEAYLQAIRDVGINRLSIGIQSCDDTLLLLIGRRHTAQQALTAVQMAQDAGFDNISIDLMYALPTQTMEKWEADIETALSLNVQHISSYGLMYEEGTALTRQMEEGTLTAIDEDTENAMYDALCKRLQAAGFVHYEVSNFALPGYESKHNSSYWDGTPYVGVGAGAHSYIRNIRSWNPDDLDAYIQGITKGTLVRESEMLSEANLYNERVMLGLRTTKGIPQTEIRSEISKYVEAGLLQEKDGRIVATQKGIHILNRIIEELMI
jgi:oxygen-independent coproporphyrinogen-3 oxidase